MSALSIVVPVTSEDRRFKAFLVRLLQAVAPLNGSEIIIVDGTPGRAVSTTCRSNGVCVIRAPAGRAVQMSRGAAQARGDYVLFLNPDITLPANFADLWRDIRRAGTVWGFFSLRANRAPWRLRWLARVISLRSRVSGIAVEDQPLFVLRNAWRLVDDVDTGVVCDFVGLCRRLRVISAPCVVRQSVDHDITGWSQATWGRILCASLSSRLHFNTEAMPPSRAALASNQTNAGRKRTAELP